jgi:Oxidoreductase family, NAD-binding Rossmann fold
MPHEPEAATAPLRVGVIGGGAAAEGIHLPALQRTAGIALAAIVDPRKTRTDELARAFGVGAGFNDYRDAISHIDAAILGVPHQLHAPIAIELLGAGDTARRVLGFTPQFAFARGMELTGAWAEWANLL